MMLELNFTTNNRQSKHSKLIDSSKLDWFYEMLKKTGDISNIDFGKIWFFSEDKNLHTILDINAGRYKFVSDMEFTNPKRFDKFLQLNDNKKNWAWYKFGVSAWGSLLYLTYPNFENGITLDIDLFAMKFSAEELNLYSEIMNSDSNEILNKFGENFLSKYDIHDESDIESIADWVQEGMKLNGKPYMNKIIFDNLLGINFIRLSSPMVVYRTWNNTDNLPDSWVSTSLCDTPYYDTGKFDCYVLPVGFPVCFTVMEGKNWADDKEIIVRSSDLLQL